MRGSQLITRGEVIRLMEDGALVKCRVLSCVATEGGGCLAGLEILEGNRIGETITAKLRACDTEAG
jgi:hypothetical protein